MICGISETLDGGRARVRNRRMRSPLFTIFCFSGSVHCWRAGSTVQFLEGRGTLTLSLLNCGSIRSRRIRRTTSDTFFAIRKLALVILSFVCWLIGIKFYITAQFEPFPWKIQQDPVKNTTREKISEWDSLVRVWLSHWHEIHSLHANRKVHNYFYIELVVLFRLQRIFFAISNVRDKKQYFSAVVSFSKIISFMRHLCIFCFV